MTKAWFVGLVNDQAEWTAATELSNLGFPVHVSLRFERVQDGRRVRAEPSLRMPGYISVYLDDDPDQGEIGAASRCKGMDDSSGSAILRGAGGKPYALPPGTVEALRGIERDDFFRARSRSKPKPRADLAPGDLVELNLLGDAFHGKRGEYQGSQRGKAIVLFGAIPKVVRDVDLKKVAQEKAA